MARPSLGIQRIEALHYYVHDLERRARFMVDKLDFAELGASGPELERDGRQRSAVFQAGDAPASSAEPVGEGGRAWRYLRKHPEGVGHGRVRGRGDRTRLPPARRARRHVITDVAALRTDDGGTLAMFSITTPFGDTTFRFVERRGYRALFPGFVPRTARRAAAGNRVRLQARSIT